MTTKSTPKILVPLDGSTLAEQAIPFAAALAEPDEELVLFHVADGPTPPSDVRGWRLPMTDQDLAKQEDLTRQALAATGERWHDVATRFDVRVGEGDPAREILRAAGEIGAELIVMASHGRGALGRWTFGSVADRVARVSPVPVMIVRAQDASVEVAPASISRFVVPLDGSDLATQALPVAARLAQRTQRPVHLVCAIPPADDLLVPTPGFGLPRANEAYRDAVAALEEQANRMLVDNARAVERADIPVTQQLAEGQPFAAIVDATHPGDVIVLTSHGHGGPAWWALGSVAEKLIRHAPGPVVVVRPRVAKRSAGTRAALRARRPHPGMAVLGADGGRIGRVKAVSEIDVLVDRPLQPDLYVPLGAVALVEDGQIVLAVAADQVDHMGWPDTLVAG
jgi:nucleotide-binding universal stress UspA family protein